MRTATIVYLWVPTGSPRAVECGSMCLIHGLRPGPMNHAIWSERRASDSIGACRRDRRRHPKPSSPRRTPGPTVRRSLAMRCTRAGIAGSHDGVVTAVDPGVRPLLSGEKPRRPQNTRHPGEGRDPLRSLSVRGIECSGVVLSLRVRPRRVSARQPTYFLTSAECEQVVQSVDGPCALRASTWARFIPGAPSDSQRSNSSG